MKIPICRLALLLAAIVLIISTGCRKAATPPPAAPPAAPSAGLPELNHSLGGNTPLAQIKFFKGSIGASLDLQMKLVRTGDQLSGSYYYEKVGTRIDLRGVVDKDGNMTLEEFEPGGKQTGMFKGVWTVDGSDGLVTLAGNWSKPPS